MRAATTYMDDVPPDDVPPDPFAAAAAPDALSELQEKFNQEIAAREEKERALTVRAPPPFASPSPFPDPPP